MGAWIPYDTPMLPNLIKRGIDVRVVQELLGHNDIRTTMLFTHITDIDKKTTPSPLDFL